MRQEDGPTRLSDAGLPAPLRLVVGLTRIVVREGLRGGDVAGAIADYPRRPFSFGSTAFEVAIGAAAAWATVTLWASAMGLLVGIGYYLGLFQTAAWVPLGFIVGGIVLMAGATVVVVRRIRKRSKLGLARIYVSLAKEVLGRDHFLPAEREYVRERVERYVDLAEIDAVLRTRRGTADVARLPSLSPANRLQLARRIFPLTYLADGVLSDGAKGQFSVLCAQLALDPGARDEVRRDYEARLDDAWAGMEDVLRVAGRLLRAADVGEEAFETLRPAARALVAFDPRRASDPRRDAAERLLGSAADRAPAGESGRAANRARSAILGGAALAAAAVKGSEQRARLDRAIDEAIGETDALTPPEKAALVALTRKVVRAYDDAVERERTPPAAWPDRGRR